MFAKNRCPLQARCESTAAAGKASFTRSHWHSSVGGINVSLEERRFLQEHGAKELQAKVAAAVVTLMPVARTISFSEASSISKVSQCSLSAGDVFMLTPEAVRSSMGRTLGFPSAFKPEQSKAQLT